MVKAEIYVVVVLKIQKENVAFIPVQKQSFYRFLLSLEECGQGKTHCDTSERSAALSLIPIIS